MHAWSAYPAGRDTRRQAIARPRQRRQERGDNTGVYPRASAGCGGWQRVARRVMRPAVGMVDRESDLVLVERGAGVATLRLNRPRALNALDADTLRALAAALGRGEGDEEVRAVVITGAGERAFCAGADIAAMAAMGATDGHGYSRLGHEVLDRVDDFPIPVVAAVNGVALGGG